MEEAEEQGVEECPVEDFFEAGFQGDDFGGGEMVVGDWILESGLTGASPCPRGVVVAVGIVECRFCLTPPFFNRKFPLCSRIKSLFHRRRRDNILSNS